VPAARVHQQIDIAYTAADDERAKSRRGVTAQVQQARPDSLVGPGPPLPRVWALWPHF
jgi:hypothetical protein